VLLAAGAAWILVTRRVPAVTRRPFPAPPRPALVAAAAATGILTGLLALGILAVPAAAGAVAALAAAVPFSVAGARRRRAVEELADAWPDVLARMRARIASGAALPEAFVAAVAGGPPALQEAGEHVAAAVAYGDGFVAALERLRTRLEDATADRVITTIVAAHGTGGARVGRILAALGVSVADELRLRKAHHAALTEQRLTAVVALVAPWGLLALTIATNPQAAEVYRTAHGTLLLALGLGATGTGYLLARRTARLARPPRVFR